MKETFNQLPLESIKIYAPNFECNVDGGSDSPTTNDQDLPPGSDSTLQSDLMSNHHQLTPLFFKRLAPDHALSIPFEHTPAYLKTNRTRFRTTSMPPDSAMSMTGDNLPIKTVRMSKVIVQCVALCVLHMQCSRTLQRALLCCYVSISGFSHLILC